MSHMPHTLPGDQATEFEDVTQCHHAKIDRGYVYGASISYQIDKRVSVNASYRAYSLGVKGDYYSPVFDKAKTSMLWLGVKL